MSDVKFSIIICCYNEEKNIKDLFLSLNNIIYDHNNYEIIIIDDGSNDETINSIKNFSKLISNDVDIKFYTINRSGLSIARNTGYYLSKYNYCLFCDADAIIHSDILIEYEKKIIEDSFYIYAGRIKNLNTLDPISNLIYNLHNEPSLNLAKNKLIGANMLLNKNLVNIKFPFFDYFKARGDETAMYVNLSQKYNIKNSIYVEKAIVKNETSSTFFDWFKKMFIEGFNNKIIENFFNKNNKKYFTYSLLKINSFILTLLIILLLFHKINFILIFSSLLFILRILPRLKYFIRGIKNIIRINLLLSIFSPFLIIIGVIISDIGYSIAFLTNKKMKSTKTRAKKITEI